MVCSECFAAVGPQAGPFCPRCGRFFDGAEGPPRLCSECLTSPPRFSALRAVGRYDGALRRIILVFKYGRFPVLGRRLGRLAAACLEAHPDITAGLDAVVAVPLHRKRRLERGFNQSLLIAREIAASRGITLVERVLVRIRDAPAQASLEAPGRKRNVRGIYKVKHPERVAGRIVLLVDDVVTTGATAGECSLVLLRAGAREVRVFVLARA